MSWSYKLVVSTCWCGCPDWGCWILLIDWELNSHFDIRSDRNNDLVLGRHNVLREDRSLGCDFGG